MPNIGPGFDRYTRQFFPQCQSALKVSLTVGLYSIPVISYCYNVFVWLPWLQVVLGSLTSSCTYDSTISYTVVIENNSGETVARRVIFSNEGHCSTIFNSSDHYCRVGIQASNMFGNSNTVYAKGIMHEATCTQSKEMSQLIMVKSWAAAKVIMHAYNNSKRGF